MDLPKLSECKTLQEVHKQNLAIKKMAMDLVSEPLVQNGYMMSNQPGATVYINVSSMAKKRLAKLFPTADWKQPVFERLMAEAKLICAQCIHLKYECRERRQPYDHLKDATERINHLVKNNLKDYTDTIKKLEVKHDDVQPCVRYISARSHRRY